MRKTHFFCFFAKDVKKCSEVRKVIPLCRVAPSAPVTVGAEYDAKIEDTAREGDGIARVEGFVILVPVPK